MVTDLTISNVFFALSLTNGRAMMGIRSLALGWPLLLPNISSCEASILYGTDIVDDWAMSDVKELQRNRSIREL